MKNAIFSHSIQELRRPRDEVVRQQNALLAEATQVCAPLEFDGMVVRIELYHLCRPKAGPRAPWHSHPFMELTWVEGGPMIYEQDERTLVVKDGECFLMPALTTHRWQAPQADTILHGFMLTVLPALKGEHSLATRFSNAAADLGHRLSHAPDAVASLQRAEEEALRGDALGALAAAGYLQAGLAQVFRQVMDTPVDAAPSVSGQSTQPMAVQEATAFIAGHLTAPLEVATVAKQVQLSVRQLDRLFNTAFEMPTGAFIRHMRLERARYLLSDSTMSIKQIARASGFRDANYFSRIFRQRHGQTPGSYRQEQAG